MTTNHVDPITGGIYFTAETLRQLSEQSPDGATYSRNLDLAMAPFEEEVKRVIARNIAEHEKEQAA